MSNALEQKTILILGCGNILFGDDGFGPTVVDRLLQEGTLPSHVLALNVGTSVREVLLDLLLSESKPRRLIILDAVDHADRRPGEVFEIPVEDIAPEKIADFSLHQFPTVNLLRELQDHFPVRVTILVAQVQNLPDQVQPGLSPSMRQAVAEACLMVQQWLG
ncbi:MAG: hydrogenase maturation protease [Deltaproteobacteria bacterium]|nr:hydrogenase maturation protease [Deltaproteobacteria bacterium]